MVWIGNDVKYVSLFVCNSADVASQPKKTQGTVIVRVLHFVLSKYKYTLFYVLIVLLCALIVFFYVLFV
jgi:hypothetical protein